MFIFKRLVAWQLSCSSSCADGSDDFSCETYSEVLIDPSYNNTKYINYYSLLIIYAHFAPRIRTAPASSLCIHYNKSNNKYGAYFMVYYCKLPIPEPNRCMFS